MIPINNDWQFTPEFSEEFLEGKGAAETIRIPHTVKTLPLHYANDKDYQMISGYRKTLFVPEKYQGKRLFLHFEGAAHIACVYVNGKKAAEHYCGYTAFRAEISDLVEYGKDNLIVVRLDSTENPAVPPFGYVIDYLTYGGIYRPVWLDVEEETYIDDIFVKNTDVRKIEVTVSVDPKKDIEKTVQIFSAEDTLVYEITGTDETFRIDLQDARIWSDKDPYLYTLRVSLNNGAVKEVTFGFRKIEFKPDGFYLNGEKTFIHGLDRHQCYP